MSINFETPPASPVGPLAAAGQCAHPGTRSHLRSGRIRGASGRFGLGDFMQSRLAARIARKGTSSVTHHHDLSDTLDAEGNARGRASTARPERFPVALIARWTTLRSGCCDPARTLKRETARCN